MSKQKGFFASHAKSSAALISLGIHALIIVLALSFVAVTVITKAEVDFEVKEVKRPKMPLKQLKVPVNVKKTQAPKLRKQITAVPKIKQQVPDIKMPEIVGVKGGLGGSGGGLGGGGSLGFAMPEIDFFGVKGQSEKIMIILDGNRYMADDSLGGAYGFEVIKDECLKLFGRLPATALFNMIVYDGDRAIQLFTDMTPASPQNVQQAKDWLMPLNQVKGTQTKYGSGTLGPGGSKAEGKYPFGRFTEEAVYPRVWNIPIFVSMQNHADTVFLLTHDWGWFGYDLVDGRAFRNEWNKTSDGKKWAEAVAKARKMLDEDNARRKAAGEPPNAVSRSSERGVVRAYLKGTPEPPNPEQARLGVADFVDAFEEAYKTYVRDTPTLGLRKKNKSKLKYSLNVIFFKPEQFEDERDKMYNDRDEAGFKALAKSFNGTCNAVVGLEAIKKYVTASDFDK